jgi:hypothetical protein
MPDDTNGPPTEADDGDDERSLPRRLFQWFLDIVEFVLSLF